MLRNFDKLVSDAARFVKRAMIDQMRATVTHGWRADLVDVVTSDGVVECVVEVVEQPDHLYRTTFGRQHREPDDIGEVDRRARIHLRGHAAPSLQLVRYVTTAQRLVHCSRNFTSLGDGYNSYDSTSIHPQFDRATTTRRLRYDRPVA